MLNQFELPAKYKTGHEHIDGHHAHLFNILYSIVNVVKNRDKYTASQIDEEIYQLFAELKKYSKNHFAYEERVMEKCHYPEIEQHRELHKGFIKKITDIQQEAGRLHEEKFAVLNETINFLRDWYLEHIFIEDKKLIAHQKKWDKKK